ncbi:MAG TPA: TrkA family potassium uptake protein [Acidimicrobiia bacterium]|nr:TrkA family potassium uptake protein [Acidimicrobiia bacterium]
MKRILIVGGGKIGSHLAELLIPSGHEVVLVETDPKRASKLRVRFGEDMVVHGSGTDPTVLETGGVHRCDVVAAVTGADETNLAVTALARFSFGVERTVARVNDPRNAWMFGGDMGVDAAIDQAELLGHLIAEEMSLGDMRILLELRRGSYSLVEERVGVDAAAEGRRVSDLDLPPGCVLVTIIRGGEVIPVRGSLVILAGDDVLALAHSDTMQRLAELLT